MCVYVFYTDYLFRHFNKKTKCTSQIINFVLVSFDHPTPEMRGEYNGFSTDIIALYGHSGKVFQCLH